MTSGTQIRLSSDRTFKQNTIVFSFVSNQVFFVLVLVFALFMALFHIVSCSKTHHALTGDGTTWNVSCATGCCGHVTYHLDLCGARVWLSSPCSLSPLTTSCHPTSWEAADTVCVQELSVVCIMHLLSSPKVCGISHCLLIKDTGSHLSFSGHSIIKQKLHECTHNQYKQG